MSVDAPKAVRPGEELDLGRLAAFLRAQDLPAEGLSQQQFPKGHSNLTYLVRAGGQEFVLRRPPVGSKVRTAHDMGREARILLKLQPVFPLAPRVVAVCDDVSVLGAPFYLMERIQGVILRGPQPRGIEVSPAQARGIGISFARTLAALHAVDFRDAGLEGMGTALGYWVEAEDPEPLKAFAFGPTFLPGSLTRQEIVEEYARAAGRELPSMLFYTCFALFKTAVVAQQIYKRYVEGLTKDERFAALGLGVPLLARAAVQAASRGKF